MITIKIQSTSMDKVKTYYLFDFLPIWRVKIIH